MNANSLVKQSVAVWLFLHSLGSTLAVELMWDWNSGTTEGWVGRRGDTQLSIEPGRQGTFGLGAVNGPPYTTAVFPVLEISGQPIVPGMLVGNAIGHYLPMTSTIFVDINRPIGGKHNYVDLLVFGEETIAQFHTYPHDGIGEIEDLGDGWYRHHLANRFNLPLDPFLPLAPDDLPGTMLLMWNFNFDAIDVPVVFDNFTVRFGAPHVPEQASLWTLPIAAMGLILMQTYLNRQRHIRNPRGNP